MDLSNISVNAQSSIRIEGSRVIYFDPFEIGQEAHDADVIFVTHAHYDHFDPESIDRITKDGTVFVFPESMRKDVRKNGGIPVDACRFLEPDSSAGIDGLKVEAVASYNVLKPFHPKLNRWVGYVVTLDGVRYYVAGDTDENKDNLKVKCDVALVPIGGHYTMDAKQAARFILKISPRACVPTHYGGIVGKPEDGIRFKEYVESENKEIQVSIKL